MTRPHRSAALEAQWIDLAQRFESGADYLVSPPLPSFKAAADFRLKFYTFRGMLRRESNIYTAIFDIRALVRPIEGSTEWVVEFVHKDATDVAGVLEEMLAAPDDDNTKEQDSE